MYSKLVSIIIPMFNSEKTILNAIESALKQTYLNIEIIVIDDGSTDKSFDIVSKLAKINKIRLISQKNKGPSAARNLGIKISNGEYIAFLDSDDCWYNNKLQKQIEAFNKNVNIGLVATRIDNKSYFENFETITFKKYLFSIKGFNLNTPTIILKKEVIDTVGDFDENIKYCEDAEYWLRILEKFEGIMINQKLVSCGDGKEIFGEAGLSANLNEMSKGLYHNYKILLRKNKIKKIEFVYLSLILLLKHIRRQLITYFRGKKCI